MLVSRRKDEPFIFWLANEFLPGEASQEELEPISNREFFISIGLITAFLTAMGIIFQTQ